jgi:hypothetical protein
VRRYLSYRRGAASRTATFADKCELLKLQWKRLQPSSLNLSQSFIVGPNRRIALAGSFAETIAIDDLDVTAGVADNSPLPGPL